MAARVSGGTTSGLRGTVVRPRSLRDQVYDRLRVAIQSGELGPGAPVIEADIAAMLGASRTPVREALRRLETEGMLEPRGARGSIVRELKRDEVDCVFDIREALETLAARRAARRLTERDAAEITRMVERMARHVDDPIEMERLDTMFHDRILAISDGVRLKRMLGDLRSDILPWRTVALGTLERRRETVEEHAAILAALIARDDDRVVATTTLHVRNSKRAVAARGDAA